MGNCSRLTADPTAWELPDDTHWKSGCGRICCVEMPSTNVYLPVKSGELWPFRASAVSSSWVRYLCTCQRPCFANGAFTDRAGYKLGGYWMSTMLVGCRVTKKWFTGTSVNSTLNASGNRVQDLLYCSKLEGVNGITKKCYFAYSELGRKKQSKCWWEYSRELCKAGKTISWWMVENWRSKDPVDPFITVRDVGNHLHSALLPSSCKMKTAKNTKHPPWVWKPKYCNSPLRMWSFFSWHRKRRLQKCQKQMKCIITAMPIRKCWMWTQSCLQNAFRSPH